jgi:cyclophilin family peptidyl-prolyl cis-trans isomerase
MTWKRHHTSLVLAYLGLVTVLIACGAEKETTPVPAVAAPKPAAAVAAPAAPAPIPKPVEAAMPKTYSATPPVTIDSNKSYTATIVLEKGGEIVFELYPKEAPNTVNSFVFLARDGYYDGVTFHRVIPGFMAQGGDPTGTGRGGPGYEIDNELTPLRRHDGPGVLSTANRGIVNGRGTNGSQFFITLTATPALDGYNADGSAKDCAAPRTSCHTVFGKVIGGMDVLNSISERDPGTATSPGDAIKTIRIEEGQ